MEVNGKEATAVPKAASAVVATGAANAAVTAAAVDPTQAAMAMPPPAGPPPGPPLPPGWVMVPHEDDHYYWNTVTGETSWEHPAEPKKAPRKRRKKCLPRSTECLSATLVESLVDRA